MKGRSVVPGDAAGEPHSALRGVVWLLLTLVLFVIVFLPILAR